MAAAAGHFGIVYLAAPAIADRLGVTQGADRRAKAPSAQRKEMAIWRTRAQQPARSRMLGLPTKRARTTRTSGRVEFAINGDMDRLWAVIQELCARTDPEDLETISLIGAAPLEELLVTFGDAAMDLVEPAVDKSTTLLRALAMVWGWNAPVRPRIERALELRGQAPL